MSNRELTAVIEIASKITGRRYCSHHGSEVDAQEGSFVVRNKSKRWICNACQLKSAKRTAEIKKQSTVQI